MNIKFIDLFLSTLFSLFLSNKIYGFLYDKVPYFGLTDFYVSTPIFDNHHKHLDLGIYFVFLILTFLVLPIFVFLRKKIIKKEFHFKFDFLEKFEPIYKKIYDFLIKFQIFGVVGYIFLHPFDGHFYPRVFILILGLILISLFDLYKRNKNEIKTLSPFLIAPFIFIFLFNNYSQSVISLDSHHFGERFATYFLYEKYNLQFYKDIMLVHGFMDIFPPFLGDKLFNLFNVQGFTLADTFLSNIRIIISLILGLFIFSSAPYLMGFALLFPFSPLFIFASAFILLLKKENLNRPYFSLFLYFIFAILFSIYWTTMGTFWVVSSLPLAIYILYKIFKNNDKNKIIKLSLISLFIALIAFLLKDLAFDYLIQAKNYVKGNIFGFGNDFSQFVDLIWHSTRSFALIVVPFIIFEFIKTIKNKEKNISYLLFLSFILIFPFVSLNYTLGRIDYHLLTRIIPISNVFIVLFVPYFLYKKGLANNKIVKAFFALVILFGSINLISAHTIKNFKKLIKPKTQMEKDINYIGEMKFEKIQKDWLINQKKLINENTKGEYKFFDLNNQGMNYLYFNKNIPVLYVSFFNSITTKQAKESLERLQKNPPDVILIAKEPIYYEDIYPNLRINPVYRWIFLEKRYDFKELNGQIILVRTKTQKELSKKDLYKLDKKLSREQLIHLPEAWANSIKTLPIKKADVDFEYKINEKEITITFKNPIKGDMVDLIYINPTLSKEIKTKKYKIEINDNESIIYCDSVKGHILVPFDNYPSWLVQDEIKEIKIKFKNKGNIFKNSIVELYKRNN